LRALDEIDGIDWIRVLYNYPNYFTDELYETLAGASKVVPYLDMPLQHINDRMLKMMNRRHTRAETEAIVARLRESIPGLVLRTTFIVGFPGETEDEFAELLEYVKATRFERLGVFPYSFEPDTPAAKLPGHLSDDVKAERRDRVMAAQQSIAFAYNRGLIGRETDVLIDAPAEGSKNLWVGRTFADAPDVDGVTYVRGAHLEPGDLVECEIVASEGYDTVAQAGDRPPRRRRVRPKARKKPPSPLHILE
jgi:ribosomal protein S12 methylthiotransferase